MDLRHPTAALAGAALALGGLSACGASDDDAIVIGSAAFAENEIVAEVYAQALESEGLSIDRKFQIGSREVYLKSLESGEIDLIPEYAGNTLLYYDDTATAATPEDVEKALEDVLPEGIEALDYAAAESKDTVTVTREFSEKNGVTSIPDIAKLPSFRLRANPEFEQRPYGLPGLEGVYGLTNIEFSSDSDYGESKTQDGLEAGDFDGADIYTTNPGIEERDLVILEDPEGIILSQNLTPLLRDDLSEEDAETVERVLDKVSAALTTADLLEFNIAYKNDKAAPATIAKDWLEEKSLI